MKPVKLLVFFSFLLHPSLSFQQTSEDEKLVPWVMDEVYDGGHLDSFNKLRYEVPVLMRQTLIDLAVGCGLDFREGWRTPLTVRFVDGSPIGAESALAFVQSMEYGNGTFNQSLNVNLAAYASERFNFDKVFAHELVHAMLNDALGRESNDLPVWFHEGLAVYGANQGEQMTEAYVTRYPGANTSYFINGLEGSHSALDYTEDYLAFKYIHDEHGINSLRGLVQEVIKRKGDIPGSIEFSCFENWDAFQENARKFAEEEISRLDRQRPPHTSDAKPY